MHGKIKKANCQKALDALTDDGHLQAKEFGKAKKEAGKRQNIFGMEDELKVAPKGVDKNHKYVTVDFPARRRLLLRVYSAC